MERGARDGHRVAQSVSTPIRGTKRHCRSLMVSCGRKKLLYKEGVPLTFPVRTWASETMAVTTLEISYQNKHRQLVATGQLLGLVYVLVFLGLFPLQLFGHLFHVELCRSSKYLEKIFLSVKNEG